MNLLHDVSLGKKAPEICNAIIEMPRGSSNKYEVDKETGLIKLDRVIHAAMFTPMDYGFLPQTHWHDGDALDVLAITTFSLVPGTLVEIRIIGVMHMVDNGERDEKIIGVASKDPHFSEINDIKDVAPHVLAELKHYYEHYKDLEKKKVEVSGFAGKNEALKVIEEGAKMYKINNQK